MVELTFILIERLLFLSQLGPLHGSGAFHTPGNSQAPPGEFLGVVPMALFIFLLFVS